MNVGDIVDDFELDDEQGVRRSLTGLLADGPIVLFFYPAAMTAGCTAEACHFRDIAAEFRAVGAQPVGISGDSVRGRPSSHPGTRSGIRCSPTRTGRSGSGSASSETLGFASTKRVTFVIDTDRRILEVIKSEIRMNVHADKALAALRTRH